MKKILIISSFLTISSLVILSTMTTTDANASLPNDGNAGAPSGDVNDHDDNDAVVFAGRAETTTTTSMTTRRRAK